MSKKEKVWLTVAILSVVVSAICTFASVLIFVRDNRVAKAETQQFPPVEIVNTKSIVEEVNNVTQKKELGLFTLTAYCSCEKCCGEWANNRPVDDMGNEIVLGASGHRLVPNVSVAVDPAVIPYGTELEIDGQKYIAHDCGGAIKENRIDVYFADHQEALNFGVKTSEVYIGGEGL